MPETQSDVINLGPWIISAIALLQVWLIALFKKFRKAKVSVFESGTIEIGFSNFGPTIGLTGTLTTEQKDVFIKNINLKLIKRKDNSTHYFSWKAFRANTVSLTSDQPSQLEIASSFLLKKENPHKYNIVFIESSYVPETNPKVAQIPKNWFEFKKEQYESLSEEDKEAVSKHDIDMVTQLLYDEFLNSGKTTKEYTALDRSFYWEEGAYDLEFEIEAPNTETKYSKTFSFTLKEEEVSQLRLNILGIIRSMCGFSYHWYFAYSEYIDNDKV